MGIGLMLRRYLVDYWKITLLAEILVLTGIAVKEPAMDFDLFLSCILVSSILVIVHLAIIVANNGYTIENEMGIVLGRSEPFPTGERAALDYMDGDLCKECLRKLEFGKGGETLYYCFDKCGKPIHEECYVKIIKRFAHRQHPAYCPSCFSQSPLLIARKTETV